MSINGVFRTSVSGMNAQANKLSVVSDNISNADTNGYKRGGAEFSSLLLPSSSGNYNSGAVQTQIRHEIGKQGAISATSSPTDLAIQGNGFFVVQDNAGREFYTRAGSFVQKTNADTGQTNLVNAGGYQLTGTDLKTGATGPIKLPVGDPVGPTATSAVTMKLQLPPSAEAIPAANSAGANTENSQFTRKSSVVVYDGVGAKTTLDVYMTKTDANTWEIAAYDHGKAAEGGGFPYTTDAVKTTVTFDPKTGLPTADPAAMDFTLPTGETAQLKFGSLTEYASDFSARIDANGNPPGQISEFSFADDGTLSGVLADGSQIALYRANMAKFQSPDQLNAKSGNVFEATRESGTAEFGTAGSGGFGVIASGAVEQSNVDMANELTDMIQSQRSYSANSKVFQTGSEILDVLINLKR